MSLFLVPADRNRGRPSHLRQSQRPKSAIGPDSLELKATRINNLTLASSCHVAKITPCLGFDDPGPVIFPSRTLLGHGEDWSR